MPRIDAASDKTSTLLDAVAQAPKITAARDTWERDTRLAHAMGYAAALLRHQLIDVAEYDQLLVEYRKARDEWQAPPGE